MNLIYEIIGYPLGWIMWAVYQLISNYGVAIILFTIITKLILFPISVKQQKSMARMNSFQPKLQALQKKYGNNKEKLQEEQMKLYAEEGVNPMGSCMPMLLQFVILFGIIDVVYKPLTHILRMSKDTIASATEIARGILEAAQVNMNNFAGRPQLYIMQAFNMNPDAFSSLPADFGTQITNLYESMNFLGIDLGAMPSMAFPVILIPILAGVSQLVYTIYMQWYQKKKNPTMPSMGGMQIMMYTMPILSVFFAFQFPLGVGVYWIIQSIIGLVQQVILNKVYTPERVEELVKKEEAKKKKKGPSYMQRMMQQQQEMMKNGGNAPVQTTAREVKSGDKMSKSAQKEMNSKIIAEARKRMAEKYGEDYDDSED